MSTDGRTQMLFNVEELSARDGTLFKSFVRLIDHRAHHRWICTSGPSDLRVVAEDTLVPLHDGNSQRTPVPPILTVGARRRELPHHISLPLHANELEQELNILGSLILETRAAVPAIDIGSDVVKLRRWPAPGLLNTLGRIRLATLMTANGITLAAAPALSGMDRESSFLFLEELNKAGLLQAHRPDPSARTNVYSDISRAQGATEQRSLFSLIRNRLGLARPSRT